MKSLVSDQLGLRDAEPRFRTDTRGIYTHMVGVPAADSLLSPRARRGLSSPLGQATLHHVFDGGWIWVIPFGDHRFATNPITSVGLLLDRRKHGAAAVPPEQEFRSVVSRFPTIARHFEQASAVRPWIGSFGDPAAGVPTFTLQAGARHVAWYRSRAPQRWKEQCDFPLGGYARHALSFLVSAGGAAAGRLGTDGRDVFRARNREPNHRQNGWPAAPRAELLADREVDMVRAG